MNRLFLFFDGVPILERIGCFETLDRFFPVVNLSVESIPAVVFLSVDNVEKLALFYVFKQHDTLLYVEHFLKAILDPTTESFMVGVSIDLDQHIDDLLNSERLLRLRRQHQELLQSLLKHRREQHEQLGVTLRESLLPFTFLALDNEQWQVVFIAPKHTHPRLRKAQHRRQLPTLSQLHALVFQHVSAHVERLRNARHLDVFDRRFVRFGDAGVGFLLFVEFVGVIGLEQVLAVFGGQGQRHHFYVLGRDGNDAHVGQLEQVDQLTILNKVKGCGVLSLLEDSDEQLHLVVDLEHPRHEHLHHVQLTQRYRLLHTPARE